VELMLQKGARNYNMAMDNAAMCGHQNIVDLIRGWQVTHP